MKGAPHDFYPPFPTNVPVATLQKVHLADLDNDSECQKLFESCQQLGFFLLDLRRQSDGEALLADLAKVFELEKRLFDLPDDVKVRFSLRDGTAYGYKGVGFSKVDRKGTPDRCEFWGISKDEIIGVTDARQELPQILEDSRTLLQEFIRRSHGICMLILSHLEQYLHLLPGSLTKLHTFQCSSTDQVRLLKMAPQPEQDRRTSLLPHTDFDSLTLVWNILGGLQIQLPGLVGGEHDWKYVKPEPGCVVVNVGDALVKLTNGAFRSNLHRVTYAPGEQAIYDRFSIAYFSRPLNAVRMRSVFDEKETAINSQEERAYTMKEWVAVRTELYRNGGAEMQTSGGNT